MTTVLNARNNNILVTATKISRHRVLCYLRAWGQGFSANGDNFGRQIPFVLPPTTRGFVEVESEFEAGVHPANHHTTTQNAFSRCRHSAASE